MREIPKTAIDLIKRFEGFSADKYICPAGYETFGYGSLCSHYPNIIFPITKDEAENCLKQDLNRFAISVCKLIKVPINDNQYSALLDFTYNLGSGTLQRSTLRAKLNRGEYDSAANEFMRYIYGGGRILPGLLKRRQAEYDLFMMN